MSLSKSKKVIAALFAGSFIAVSAVAGVSAGAAGSESGIFGDINNDGTVNAKDLTRLMKYIAGEKVEAYGVDLNGDGKENAKDLTRLMKYIADPSSVEIPETTGKQDSDTVTEPATDTETDPANPILRQSLQPTLRQILQPTLRRIPQPILRRILQLILKQTL